MNKELIERIQELFFEKLQGKTNWGRDILKYMYKDAVNQALLEHVDKKSQQPNSNNLF